MVMSCCSLAEEIIFLRKNGELPLTSVRLITPVSATNITQFKAIRDDGKMKRKRQLQIG